MSVLEAALQLVRAGDRIRTLQAAQRATGRALVTAVDETAVCEAVWMFDGGTGPVPARLNRTNQYRSDRAQ